MPACDFTDRGEKTADCPRLLPVEAPATKNAPNVAGRSTFERIPRWVGSAQVGPSRTKAREIGLKAEDDVNRLVQRIRLVAQYRFRSAVGSLKHCIGVGKVGHCTGP